MLVSRWWRIDQRFGRVDADPVPTLSDAIAANVRAERARRRWRQEDLAEKTGLSRSTIGYLESGRVKVTADYIPALCRAFELPLSDLAAGADPEDLRAMGL
jgi:transcriptional regulator with XRE-family HTH domain